MGVHWGLLVTGNCRSEAMWVRGRPCSYRGAAASTRHRTRLHEDFLGLSALPYGPRRMTQVLRLQDYVEVCSLADMTALRMPVTTASRKGVSKLAAEAEHHRVVLTSHGRPVAVVDSAERLDEDLRRVREATRSVVETAADMALGRTRRFSLEEVCAKLNIDPARVRERAAAKRM